MGRYNNRIFKVTDEDIFSDHLENRGLRHITHYTTPFIPGPSDFQIGQVSYSVYTWKSTDKLRKLSARFYGDSSYWWAIGWFNRRPTDSHYKSGDQVLIPTNIEIVLRLYGY